VGHPGLTSARQCKIDRSLAPHKDMAIASMLGDMGAPPEGSSKAWHSAREGRWLTGGPQSSRAHAGSEGGCLAGTHVLPHTIMKLNASFLKAVLSPSTRESVLSVGAVTADRGDALQYAIEGIRTGAGANKPPLIRLPDTKTRQPRSGTWEEPTCTR